MIRVNRNNPTRNNWSSIALIDVPQKSEKVTVPSKRFHIVFSETDDSARYLYSLWAVLNHPIASLWLHERLRVQAITTKKLKKFPLPKSWDDKFIEILASKAKELVHEVRNKNFEVTNLIESIDDIIYNMYGISTEERKKIEDWLDLKKRPLLKPLGLPDQASSKSNPQNVPSIKSNEAEWGTTFEILDVDYQQKKIKIVIDGLPNDYDNPSNNEDGFWVKVIPAMPGWVLRKRTIGSIKLTTRNLPDLKQSPEKYIIGFRLLKNAYKSEKDIADSFSSLFDK